jgi:hypothetical protein
MTTMTILMPRMQPRQVETRLLNGFASARQCRLSAHRVDVSQAHGVNHLSALDVVSQPSR